VNVAMGKRVTSNDADVLAEDLEMSMTEIR
jgi:hypothetical protein